MILHKNSYNSYNFYNLFLSTYIFFVIPKTDAYSKFFNHWHCIGIYDEIDFSKPYSINIGELPLIIWKNKNKDILSSINICKHMGSKLDNGIINKNGCLQCPYHGLEINHKDQFGKICVHEDKLFWSYSPFLYKPHSTPFFTNKDYLNSHLCFDMPASMLDSAYNTLDLNHPQYVHNGAFGFGSSIPPQNIKHWKYSKIANSTDSLTHRIGISFDYKTTNFALSVSNSKYTNNFHMFVYPSFTWSKVSFYKNKKQNNLLISVHFLPLSEKITRWYVSIVHNYAKEKYEKEMMKTMAKIILFQDYGQMKKQADENKLKESVIFDTIFDNDKSIIEIKNQFDINYKYPNIDDCVELYNRYKFQQKLI